MADRSWISVLIDVVDHFDGAVIAHPSELARDAREVAADWLRLGWPWGLEGPGGAIWPTYLSGLASALPLLAAELSRRGLLVELHGDAVTVRLATEGPGNLILVVDRGRAAAMRTGDLGQLATPPSPGAVRTRAEP